MAPKKCAIKRKKVFNNPNLEFEVFCGMFKEFQISSRFKHPNIVDNWFFTWKESKLDKQEKEFNIIGEIVKGGNLQKYIESLVGKYIIDLK